MVVQPLDRIPLWVFFLIATTAAGLALEVGYRLGLFRHARVAGEKEAPVGAMVGSILGLVAFILAFTFNLAASRFEARRQALLEETNAIGTCYLRARILLDPQRTEIEGLLRDYVDVRIKSLEERSILEGITKSEELHEQLWSRAMTAAEKSPTPVMASLFLQSLNDVIDLHSKRVLVGVHSRIPTVMWFLLFSLTLIGMISMGYQAGLSTTRRSPAGLLLAMAFAGVLYLIVDLDRPIDGFVRVSQQSMLDLQRSMRARQR